MARSRKTLKSKVEELENQLFAQKLLIDELEQQIEKLTEQIKLFLPFSQPYIAPAPMPYGNGMGGIGVAGGGGINVQPYIPPGNGWGNFTYCTNHVAGMGDSLGNTYCIHCNALMTVGSSGSFTATSNSAGINEYTFNQDDILKQLKK